MKSKEHSAVISLSLIMAFRMLGLFMILPVFAVYAQQVPHATTFLIGLALGIYGLTQALLQMPFGRLSDSLGRKPIIAFGLILFAIGSIVAALSHSIYGVIIGRAIQGTGAVGSTIMALAADLTRDENRSKAMATLGLTIGVAFSLAIILGPIINAWFHLSGIFWITAGLAAVGLVLLFTSVPTPPKLTFHSDVEIQSNRFKSILKNKELLKLNGGIFTLHATLTALFLAIPILLTHVMKLSQGKQVILYLIVLLVAFVTMVPLIIIAEKRRQMKRVFTATIVALTLSLFLLLFFHQTVVEVAVILLLFFAGFTLLEATLPSWLSKISPIRSKGTAMGIYSSCQFFGIFVGGSLGGLIFSQFNIDGVLVLCIVLLLVWLSFAFTMKPPPYLSTLIFPVKEAAIQDPDELSHKLRSIPGVAEVAIMAEEKELYIKVDKKVVAKDELRKLIGNGRI